MTEPPDAKIALASRLIHLESKPLTLVIGSGLSNEALPNTAQFARIFLDEFVGAEHFKMKEMYEAAADDPTLAYQNMASQLIAYRGYTGISKPFRREILKNYKAAVDTTSSAHLAQVEEDTGNWNIPSAQIELAKFLRSRTSDSPTTIITTNFDPFIEIALNREIGPRTAIPVPMAASKPISPAELHVTTGIPVIHIHGFWRQGDTLHTQAQLTGERPDITRLISSEMTGSVVVVIGYGGWDDAFMHSLSSQAGILAMEETEIIWCFFHSEGDTSLSGSLKEVINAPGVQAYYGIDAAELFSTINSETTKAFEVVGNGYFLLRKPQAETTQGSDSRIEFARGAEPTWNNARDDAWPLLSNARALCTQAQDVAQGKSGGVVALGPTGEGKSMALKQVAMRVAEDNPDIAVIWRNEPAGPITEDFLKDLLDSFKSRIIVASDNADAVTQDLRHVLSTDIYGDGKVGFLLAAQDRLWERSAGSYLGLKQFDFRTISLQDARDIVSSWNSIPELASNPVDPELLFESSRTTDVQNPSSLMGGILTVQSFRGLRERVIDLLDRLDDNDKRGRSIVYQAFSAICLAHHYLDPYAQRGLGVTKTLISQVSGMEPGRVDGYILRSLGREAAITILGKVVYARHASIAKIITEELERRGEAASILDPYIACAARSVRDQAEGVEQAERAVAAIYRRVPAPLKVEAATTLLKNSKTLSMAPRVSYMWACRHEDATRGYTFGLKVLENNRHFEDRAIQLRGALVEMAYLARELEEWYWSMGYALLSLCDHEDTRMFRDQLDYSLIVVFRSAKNLSRRDSNYAKVAAIAEVIRNRAELDAQPGASMNMNGWDSSKTVAELLDLPTVELFRFLSEIGSECMMDTARECSLSLDSVSFEAGRKLVDNPIRKLRERLS